METGIRRIAGEFLMFFSYHERFGMQMQVTVQFLECYHANMRK
jgi:hypothetical protein